ncbi:MAG: EAL domain-containing protein [Hylemonella sp.]|nr:EAL domain-containing protein [Hylemonella sp.]
MRLDRKIGAIPYLLGLVAIAGSVGGAVYIGYERSLHELEERAELIASELMSRSDAISDQFDVVLHALQAQPAVAEPCSPANIALMRRLAIGARTLRVVGYVQGDRLLCSSYGHHGMGYPVGPPRYLSQRGYFIRPTVTLPFAGDEKYLMTTRQSSGYSALVLPGQAMDLPHAPDDVDFGLFSTQGKRSMLRRGPGEVPESWYATAFGEADTVSFRDADRMVVMKRSGRYDYTTYAAIPLTYMNQDWLQASLVFVPLSLITGFSIAALIVVNAMRRHSMLNLLRQALRRDELFLEYQPVVDLQTGRWVGAEALARWRGPDGKLIAPDVFIPMAERNGLIERLTTRVIECYARDTASLLGEHADFDISLNFSSRDLSGPDAVARLKSQLAQADIQPRQVVVEITESVLVQAEDVRPQIQALRTMGVRIAIDDFGTGYSGLSYLTSLELDYLKIDKAFVDTIGTDAATKNVVDHIIEIAKSLGLVMVAEGVETEVQAEYLRQRGVQYAQGWLYARAISMDALQQTVEKQRRPSLI